MVHDVQRVRWRSVNGSGAGSIPAHAIDNLFEFWGCQKWQWQEVMGLARCRLIPTLKDRDIVPPVVVFVMNSTWGTVRRSNRIEVTSCA